MFGTKWQKGVQRWIFIGLGVMVLLGAAIAFALDFLIS
jgi:hypothetical protein